MTSFKNSITKKSEEEDDDQNFIKKDEKNSEEKNLAEAKQDSQAKDAINKLKNIVFPKNNHQRNLDREVGGLEAEEKKEISGEDVWDKRSEEVDKMGSTDVFNSSGMRSAVWHKKHKKLELIRDAIEAETLAKKTKSKSGEIKAEPQSESYLTRLKNLKQDRGNEGGQNGGGICF